MASLYRGIGKVRAHGKARIAITLEARDEADFLKRWHAPVHDYPFEWERGTRFCIEYQAEDFAAEVGFYIDILGFTVDSISPSRAQFSSPDQELVLAVAAADPEDPAPQPDNLRLHMFIQNLQATADELSRRGVLFENMPEPSTVDPGLYVAAFHTPNGMTVELWGYPEASPVEKRGSYARSLEIEKPSDTAYNEYDEEDVEDEYDEEEELEELADYRTPVSGNRIHSTPVPPAIELEDDVDDDDELEEDDGEEEEPAEDKSYREDQLGLEMDNADGEEDDAEFEPEEEDDDARLDRFLEASRHQTGFTFDERVEPVQSGKPTRLHSERARSNTDNRSGRVPAGRSTANRLRKSPVRRTSIRSSPPPLEPTYDDIEDGDELS